MLASRTARIARLITALCVAGGLVVGSSASAVAVAPNVASQWNKIAEDTVVGSGAQQIEGFVYLAYTQVAVFDAVNAIKGGYRSWGPPISAPAGASAEAAVVQAAYETLAFYFPASATTLDAARTASLLAIADGPAETNGIAVGHAAAQQVITLRGGDGRQTPIASTSPFPAKAPGPGVWRLTPPAYAAPHTPWVGSMTPFIVPTANRYLPPAPPSLSSAQWVAEFNEIKVIGQDTSSLRTPTQTAIARFYTANVNRQYNRMVRDIADQRSLGLLETARLAAMVNVVAADAGISVLHTKYHYQFWRPVSAIDPMSVKPAGDGLGPVPGFDDGNPATIEQAGWRPLLVTPNHPEYPAAHGTITSAVAEVLTTFLGTNRIEVDVHGFDAAGAAGNLDAVYHFRRANDMRAQVINARLWGGLHYRSSSEAGVALGRSVAKYDLRHAFYPLR